jgi:hypothetical protein
MGRVMWLFALAALIGVVTGLILERVVVGMLVGGGIFLLGVVVLISRANPRGPEA